MVISSKKLIIILFLIFVPIWIVVYCISYFFFTSNFCIQKWPHDFSKTNCVYVGRKIFTVLEKNPIISIYTRNKILKNDILNQKYVNQVYELLAFIDFVFTKHDIKYSIDWGTELGAIRHKGFIPWDDDVDIIVFEEADKAGEILNEEIKNTHQEDRYITFKTKQNNVLRIKDGIVVDIDNLKKCKLNEYDNQERYFYTLDGTCEGIFFKKMNYNYEEIWPLKKCTFGPLELPCKNNVTRPFNVYYGDNWLQVIYTDNHTTNKNRNKKMKLTEELSRPALPTDDAWKRWIDEKNKLKK